MREGENTAILVFGTLLNICHEIADTLNASLIDMLFIKPIDEKLIIKIAQSHNIIVTIEENTISGGAGSSVLEVLSQNKLKNDTLCLGIPDRFPAHGKQDEILRDCGLDQKSILSKIEKAMN